MLIFAGAIIMVIGLLVLLSEHLPIKLGHLPGDIVYRNKNTTFYFPWVTCLVVSAILSFILWLVRSR